MRRSVLVAQASQHGVASRVGELVADTLGAHGLDVEVMPAARVAAPDRYGAVVVGGSMRRGHWHRAACRFLRRHRRTLGGVPVAVFATESHGHRDGGIERALAGAPEIEPVTSAHFAVRRRGGPAGYDLDEVRRWTEELARELGA